MSTANNPSPPDSVVTTAALLGTDAAREHLGSISLSTLKMLVRSGELRSVKIGRRRMYRRSDLDAYIAAL